MHYYQQPGLYLQLVLDETTEIKIIWATTTELPKPSVLMIMRMMRMIHEGDYGEDENDYDDDQIMQLINTYIAS